MSHPLFGLTGAQDGRLVDAQSAGCCSLWQQGVLRRSLWRTVSSKNKFNKATSCVASTKLVP